MTQANRSTKIDLPRPNPHVLYCIRKIENRPELGYCYLTVFVAPGVWGRGWPSESRGPRRDGEPYETILFYTYAPVNSGYSYGSFIEDMKGLCPLHFARIKDYLLTFEKESACPRGWNE